MKPFRWLGTACAVANFSAGAATPIVATVDPLLAIDQNRATVVDRILTEWGNPLWQSGVGLSPDQLRTMLGGLRADHLLAASLAGSLPGLRDVVSNALSATASGKSGVLQAKSLGDTADDVVYTPVIPCRLVDTRNVYAAVYQNGGAYGGSATRTYTIQGGNGVCLSQLPAGLGAAAVQLQVFGIPVAGSSGDIEILPQGTTFGGTSTEVYVGNVLINTVSTVAKINTANNQISVQVRGGTADLAIDVVGYFRVPSNFGSNNSITGQYAAAGGGANNTVSGQSSFVGGGQNNTATTNYSVVGGGFGNEAGSNGTVSGGASNAAQGVFGSVGGGFGNSASAYYSTVPGGQSNAALGVGSFAAGQFAKSNYNGCITFGDSSTMNPVSCNGPNEFVARSVNGFYFFTSGTTDSGPTIYTGAKLAPGATAWTVYSDRNGKNNIRRVDSMQVLRKVAAMPIATWNWKSQDVTVRHMGPMAQDFYAAFDLGETPLGISTVDADGVALAAIQGLHQMIRQKDAKLAQQSAKLVQQASSISAMQRRLDAISAKLGID